MCIRDRVSPDDPVLAEYASLLHDLALLAEGTAPADGAGATHRWQLGWVHPHGLALSLIHI